MYVQVRVTSAVRVSTARAASGEERYKYTVHTYVHVLLFTTYISIRLALSLSISTFFFIHCCRGFFSVVPQAPGSRIQAPGSKLQAPGSKLQAPSSNLQAPRSGSNSKLKVPRVSTPMFNFQVTSSKSLFVCQPPLPFRLPLPRRLHPHCRPSVVKTAQTSSRAT